MRTPSATAVLDQQPAPVRTRLAAAWTSFMFLYIYVDYLGLYAPGVIDDIRDGVVWRLDITQTFVVGALSLMAVPIAMVVLSTALPARALRMTTLVVAPAYVLVSAFNVVDESWTIFFGLGAALEILLLVHITRIAWAWPRTTLASRRPATSPSLPMSRTS